MRVLSTVERMRRRRLRLLLGSAATALAFLLLGCAWWLIRPGAPVERAFGLTLPPGSRRILEEHATIDPAAPFDAIYVTTTWSVDQAVDELSKIARHADADSRRFVLANGAVVIVLPADDVPATRLSPIRPVHEGVPLGTASWLVITRGEPPSATWRTAVPPDLGES